MAAVTDLRLGELMLRRSGVLRPTGDGLHYGTRSVEEVSGWASRRRFGLTMSLLLAAIVVASDIPFAPAGRKRPGETRGSR